MVDAAAKQVPLLDRLLAPRVVFSALAVFLIIAILFTPNGMNDDSRGSLSTLAYDRGGARGWYEGSRKLGWHVERRTERFRAPLDTDAVYVVLSPDVEPTAAEVNALLNAVRAGAGLIVSPFPGSPLADSLHVHRGAMEPFGFKVMGGDFTPPKGESLSANDTSRTDQVEGDSTGAATGVATDTTTDTTTDVQTDEDSDTAEVDFSQQIPDTNAPLRGRKPLTKEIVDYDRRLRFALTARRALPRDTVNFLTVMTTEGFTIRVRPAVLGIPLGRGHIIAVADPWIVRNQVLDEEELVVLPQRMLEWTAPAPDARIVFDEYHHGMGRHANVIGAMKRALSTTPVGRVALQAMLAGLVLLLALGARPIAPRPRMRVERRSPFEHVGALARAYSQIGATRLAARRLVRGLRRRHGAGVRVGDDAAFLRRLVVRHEKLRPNVERLISATETALPPREFTLLADDIDTIERTLTT